MGLLILKNPSIFKRGHTWQNRIVSFIPSLAPHASEYDATKDIVKIIDNHQVTQAKIAIAEGGIIGKLPGNSNQKYRLSQAYCDFIYAIIIEDYGLFGGIIIILLYLVILYRAGVIVRRCDYTFPALLVIGLTFSLVFQAFVHMGVAVNLLPATGQPLPIISHGASSLLTTSISFGIILGISRKIELEHSQKKQEQ
jgi:cell division protein FtsW